MFFTLHFVFFLCFFFVFAISPLPPFFLETCNHATSLLWCNNLLIVIVFLVFLSVGGPLLFHLPIPAPYFIMETPHDLVLSIEFTRQNQFWPPEIFIPKLIFHFLFFYSVIFQYHQVFISIFSLIFSLLGNSMPSVDLAFSLFIIISSHFFEFYAYILTKYLCSRH